MVVFVALSTTICGIFLEGGRDFGARHLDENDMYELISCEVWRDGGSYSATVSNGPRVVSLWLQINAWDRLEAAAYEALFVSEGPDPTQKERVAEGIESRRWLAILEREVEIGAADGPSKTRLTELIRELRVVCCRAFSELPLADPDREAHALSLFRLEMAPEEYAARHGHEFALFSFDDYRYSRPELTLWVQRLGDIFFKRYGAPTLRELRERFLTASEIETAEEYERDPF